MTSPSAEIDPSRACGPRGRLVGVGVGPGDPELVTTKAAKTLERADRVVAPATSLDSVGRAEAIVRQLLPRLKIERIAFEMRSGEADKTSARTLASRSAALTLLPWLDGGEEVAFATLGDPNIYSTFSALSREIRELRPETQVTTVPGIMAFQALAAQAGTVLLEGTEAMSLVTALDGSRAVETAISERERAVVVYKGGRHLPEIAECLGQADRLDGAIMGELLGLPGERFGPMDDHRDAPASYLATVIVPPARRATGIER